MVVGEVYGSARKIVPVVGAASRGSYGASKASAYPLVSRETVWHAWEFAVRAAHQRLAAGFTSCMRAIRFPYSQGDSPTPLTTRKSYKKRRRPPGQFSATSVHLPNYPAKFFSSVFEHPVYHNF